MNRQPSSAGASPYVTPEGFERLERELRQLWSRRTGVAAAVSAAAAEGDRSENAEYIYRKKELREIDRRIRYLQRRMPRLKIVRTVHDTARIFFGARITLEDEHGTIHRYRIVGADEIDANSGYISVDSPLARGLLGKCRDDEVEPEVRGMRTTYLVCEINYD